jgi:ornithine cyclodeaminase/alanine dehydrogenase
MDSLLLSQSDIKKLISMKEAIDACDKTFRGMGEGTVSCPAKVNLNLGDSGPFPPYNASMNAMPAYIGWQDTAGLKWAGGFGKGRVQAGMPFINALILLCQPDMGNFTAVMDGTYITNLRTGAQTAAALKYIIGDQREITAGLFGAGVQGRTQALALDEGFKLRELLVYDINDEAARCFQEEMQPLLKAGIRICSRPEEAAGGDVVVSVTLAKDGFLKRSWLGPGTVYFAMGSYQECDYETILQADRIIVDHVEQCLHRGALRELALQGKISAADITCTIGDLASGKALIGDYRKDLVLCVPIGTGAMDVAVAGLVYQKALAAGMGTPFTFDR